MDSEIPFHDEVVQFLLILRQVALVILEHLRWEVLQHFRFQSPQGKWQDHLVELVKGGLAFLQTCSCLLEMNMINLDLVTGGLRIPALHNVFQVFLSEIFLVPEVAGHEPREQCPEICRRILDRCTGKNQPTVGSELVGRFPDDRLGVSHYMALVQDNVIPYLSAKKGTIQIVEKNKRITAGLQILIRDDNEFVSIGGDRVGLPCRSPFGEKLLPFLNPVIDESAWADDQGHWWGDI